MADIERLTDAELVAAYIAGDRDAFAGIYDRYASRIFSYHLTMLRDRQEAADAAHDTLLRAAIYIEKLDDPDELRPWLFAISRNLAQARERTTPPDPGEGEGSLDGTDPRDLVMLAADELGERDQQLLALHLVEELEGEQLARAMGVDSSHIEVMVSRMKGRVEKTIEEPLRARLGDDERELQEVLKDLMVVPAPAALRPRVLDKVDKGVLASALPTLQPRDTPEWTKVAAFAVVALVLGLIGFAVSAQFEPLDPPAPVPTTESTAAVDGSTTAEGPRSSSTTQPADPTTTVATQASAPPAALEVSTESIDLGDEGTSEQFDIRNTGGQSGQWSLQASSDAIALSTGQGELAGGATVTIDLSLDRGSIEEGEFSETVTVSWGDGQTEIAVVGTNETNPIIHDPQANPSSVDVSGNPECQNTQTTVSARVRDVSPLESVVVRWSPDGNSQRETEMIAVGNDMFEAVIGPFTTAQSAEVRIVAFDERGNAGGATTPVTVAACP